MTARSVLHIYRYPVFGSPPSGNVVSCEYCTPHRGKKVDISIDEKQ